MNKAKTLESQQGVMLLEALIAILIFAIGILGIMGLQAAMIKNTNDAKYRVDASFLANQLLGQMWVDSTNFASYATGGANFLTWKNTVASTLPAGNATVAIGADGTTVTVNVLWQAGAQGTPHNYTAIENIKLN